MINILGKKDDLLNSTENWYFIAANDGTRRFDSVFAQTSNIAPEDSSLVNMMGKITNWKFSGNPSKIKKWTNVLSMILS